MAPRRGPERAAGCAGRGGRRARGVSGAVEPARLEWFLAGTEPPTAAPAIAGGHPRIIAPVSGTIIALDPDIPEGRERLVFEATDARESLRWVLDGDDLAPRASYMSGAPSAAATRWSWSTATGAWSTA